MNMNEIRRGIINDVISIEGGFSNHIEDSGGATMYGITEAVAAENGYNVRNLTKDQAYTIYERRYWHPILLDEVATLSRDIARELFDTGVNAHPSKAIKFLQRSLNSLNNRERLYPDVTVDGKMGRYTLEALSTYLKRRGENGERVLLNMLNSLQSTFYLELAESRPKDEKFQHGWQSNRVDDVETGSYQSLYGSTEPGPVVGYTLDDVRNGTAPNATFHRAQDNKYKPYSASQDTERTADLPPEFYEWQNRQRAQEFREKNAKPAYQSKIIGVAVGTMLTFVAAKFELNIPPEVAPYIETAIVGTGLTLIGIARRWFTKTDLK